MLLLQEYDFKIFQKSGKHHHGANFLLRTEKQEQLQSIRDEPVDAEFFQIQVPKDNDPEWPDVKKFLTTGEVPRELSTN